MTRTERTTQAAIDYNVTPQYGRALGGFHPTYFGDVAVLGQDGWYPFWSPKWAEKPIAPQPSRVDQKSGTSAQSDTPYGRSSMRSEREGGAFRE